MGGDVESFEITIHRSELVPGGNGARIGYSDDFQDKQFLIVPESPAGVGVGEHKEEKP